MVIKRKRDYHHIENKVADVEKKRLRNNETESDVDRLSNLPESLKLHILSRLNVKQATQTTILSKSWVSTWTQIPVLNFNSYVGFRKLADFDKFVNRVLSSRDNSVNLERLSFNRGKTCSAKILETVFGYVALNGVKELEAWIHTSRNGSWPNCLHTSSTNSLTKLTLKSSNNSNNINCPFLGPRSGAFKNLTDLYLRKPVITDLDPFSGFPALKKLTLVDCGVDNESNTLNIHANKLMELNISGFESFDRCEIIAPKLRFFSFGPYSFPLMKTPIGLPDLDTMVISFGCVCYDEKAKKRMFENFVSMFTGAYNVKSLTISPYVLELLSIFPHELVNRCSPFHGLKCLISDFRHSYDQNSFKGPRKWSNGSVELPPEVTSYLLKNSPEAKVSLILPKYVQCHM